MHNEFFLANFKSFRWNSDCRKVIGDVRNAEDQDDDVIDEQQRVINGDADSDCLRLVNLTKVSVYSGYCEANICTLDQIFVN